jgi:NAD(P)-dependent dehydrogenase (short-subunit alcohol dehydrogenase family)
MSAVIPKESHDLRVCRQGMPRCREGLGPLVADRMCCAWAADVARTPHKEQIMTQQAVVTAGTRGIGAEVALELSRRGYAVTIVGRDVERGEQMVSVMDGARFVRADLSVLAEVRALGERLAAEGPLHLLVNNVGGMWSQRRETADGIEASFALNHLSPTVLTEALLDALRAGGPSRIVHTTSSSITALSGPPSYAEIEPEEYYGMAVSGRAKLAHLAYMLELADRLKGTEVSVFAADPGPAATANAAEMTPEILPPVMRPYWEQIKASLRPPVDAAQSVVRTATDATLAGRTGLVLDPEGNPSDALTGLLTPDVVAAAKALTEGTLTARI